jgi:carboxyl-terminal processing protease
MLPACNKATGANVHTPDVCLTPPAPGVPVPYVDTAMNMTSVAFVPHVLISGSPAHNLGTINATSVGDEAGVLHWTIKGPSFYVEGSPIVMIAKLPGTHLTNATIGNTGNAPKGLVAIPSVSNVVYTLRAEPIAAEGAAPTNDDELARLYASQVAMTGAASEVVSSAIEEGDVAVIAISLFAPSAPNLFRAALTRSRAEGVRALVLDLRGNRGGDLDAALRVAEELLPRGAVLARLRDVDGDETVRTSKNDAPCDLPLLVLVDGGTASAAEVVAAALRANGRATIAGVRTHGKGWAAAFVRGEGYRITHHVFAPDGSAIDGAGVEPDFAL